MHEAMMVLQGSKFVCFKLHTQFNLYLQLLSVIIVLHNLSVQVAWSNIIEVIPESQCQNGGHLPCRTLDWYNQNTNGSFMRSNTEVRFLKGIHTLNTFIAEVRDCSNLTIIGMGHVSYSVDVTPLPSTWINCRTPFSSGFVFLNSSGIHLRKIGIGFCGRNISFCGDKFNAALSFQQGSNISLHKVVVNNTHGVGLLTDNVFNSVSIEDSVFMRAGECSNTKQMRFPLRSTVR